MATARSTRSRTAKPTPEPAQPMPAPAADTYPVVYYNPRVPDERFVRTSGSYFHRFVNGRFVATNAVEEEAVRAALRRHGPNAADRWRGDDMEIEWVSDNGSFRTFNKAAALDYKAAQGIR